MEDEEIGYDDVDESKLHFFVVCSYCAGIQKLWCQEGDSWAYMPEVYFPCPELKAIGKEMGIGE